MEKALSYTERLLCSRLVSLALYRLALIEATKFAIHKIVFSQKSVQDKVTEIFSCKDYLTLIQKGFLQMQIE